MNAVGQTARQSLARYPSNPTGIKSKYEFHACVTLWDRWADGFTEMRSANIDCRGKF